MAFFSDLPANVQTDIAQLFIEKLEQEDYDYEQTRALSTLNRAFHHVTKPWIAEWHDLFENPGEYGDWTALSHKDANNESPYIIGEQYTITKEWDDGEECYEFYYDGRRVGTFDCTDGDDTWQLFVGNTVTVEKVHSYTPDSRLTLLLGEEVELHTVYVAECDGFLVPPFALLAFD